MWKTDCSEAKPGRESAHIALIALMTFLPVAPGRAQEAQADSAQIITRAEAALYGLEGQSVDVAAGLALLEAAAGRGDGAAQNALGQLLLWGTLVPANHARAQGLLAEAARHGHIEAQRVLGENLIGGWILPADPKAGLPLLESAAAAGDGAAQISLGEFLLAGKALPQDRRRALALFEAAAASGNGAGLERYGADLMWSERDPAAAERYLARAGEMGRASAWATLAEGAMYGYLGGGSASRAKFAGYAEKARAAGDERIAVLEATRKMWGISTRASGPGTVASLTEAAEAGNAEAAKTLIALLRDGNRYNVRKDRTGAEAALTRYAALIGPAETARARFALDLAKARGPAAWATLAPRLASDPALSGTAFGMALFSANPNGATWLMQDRLKLRGLYTGPLDGLAGRGTLRAAYRACLSLPPGAACNDSVMRPEILGAILMQGAS